MDCKRFEHLLALYVENDLPERQREGLETHLAACAGCQALLAGLRESQAALKGLATLDIPDSLLDSVRSEVLARVKREGSKPDAGRRLRWALLAAAAAVAVFAAIGLPAHRRGVPRSVPSGDPIVQHSKESPLEAASKGAAGTPDDRRGDVSAESQREPDMVIRLVTDNPNVVIILLSNHEEVNHEQAKS